LTLKPGPLSRGFLLPDFGLAFGVPPYLQTKLTRPTKDDGTLHTIAQAVEYMADMGRKRL
jgi:hypothetical protein